MHTLKNILGSVVLAGTIVSSSTWSALQKTLDDGYEYLYTKQTSTPDSTTQTSISPMGDILDKDKNPTGYKLIKNKLLYNNQFIVEKIKQVEYFGDGYIKIITTGKISTIYCREEKVDIDDPESFINFGDWYVGYDKKVYYDWVRTSIEASEEHKFKTRKNWLGYAIKEHTEDPSKSILYYQGREIKQKDLWGAPTLSGRHIGWGEMQITIIDSHNKKINIKIMYGKVQNIEQEE